MPWMVDKPEAGAFADVLGGEERIKNARNDLRRHAVSRDR